MWVCMVCGVWVCGAGGFLITLVNYTVHYQIAEQSKRLLEAWPSKVFDYTIPHHLSVVDTTCRQSLIVLTIGY